MNKKIVPFVLILLFFMPLVGGPTIGKVPQDVQENQFLTSADGAESSESITGFVETLPDDVMHYPDYTAFGDRRETEDVNDYVEDCEFISDWALDNQAGTGARSFTTDGEIATISMSPITGGWDWVLYAEPLTQTIDTDVIDRLVIRWKINDTSVARMKIMLEADNIVRWSGYSSSTDPSDTWQEEKFTITSPLPIDRIKIELSDKFNEATDSGAYELSIDWVMMYDEIDFIHAQESSGYFESFVNVSDWTQNVGETWGTDGDRMYVDVPDDAGSDSYYSTVVSLSAGSQYYYEYRVETNITASAFISVNLWSDDGRTQNYKFLGNDQVGNVGKAITKKQYIDYAYDIECVQLTFTAPVGIGDLQYEVDYFRIGESDEMGWQHDGSTVEGLDTDLYQMTVATDGDVATFTTTVGAGRTKIYFDTTTTVANIELDYYPFLHLSVTECDADWSFVVYFDDDSNSILHTLASDTGVFRYNLKAVAGTKDIKYLYFLVNAATSYAKVDFFQLYSIANFTSSQGASITTNDYWYVEDGWLYGEADSGDYLSLNRDPAISVAQASYPVWNLTSTLPDLGGAFSFRLYNGVWTYFDAEDTRGAMPTGTIIDLWIVTYLDTNIGAIKFIEDGTSPSVVRSSANPPDPTDDETVTLSAVVTDTVEVYTVKFNAISTTATGFSDVDYSATEQSDNLWTYSFTKGDLPNGYYCFLITASDGANTNDPTEYAYIEFTTRESEITIQEITLLGAGQDFTMMSFSSRINKDCTYMIYEESATYPESDTWTGSVSAPSFNLAWSKLDTTDTNVNFTIVFVNGSLTENYTSQYQVAQTTFYVEDRAKTETPATVTITGRITKQANYVVYDIDGNIQETDSIDALDFRISFNKWVLDTEQEIFFAIKFTNGSQSCWINWTYYAININEYGQGPGGDSTKPPNWAMNIMYWNVFSAVIIGLGILGIFIKTGNIPNWRK